MKSKWLFLLLWMCVIVRPEAWGQEVKSANTVAEEWIQVSSSSATVLQWFEWIEKSTGIVLSYNPAQMELGDVCRIEHGGKNDCGDTCASHSLRLSGENCCSTSSEAGDSCTED